MRNRRLAIAGILIVAAAIVVYGARAPRALPEATPAVEFSASPELFDLRDAIQDLVAATLPGGLALRGAVTGTPQHLSIEASLARAHAQVEGSADSLPRLADRLVAELLAIQAARDSDELAAFRRTSPAALRAYLAGQDAYRRGKLGVASEASAHFERALFLDSTFALAGLRLAEIGVRFGISDRDERWKLDAIWNQRHRLGQADRTILDAYLGPRYPQPATLAQLIAAAERATVIAPHRAEAWHIAGISFFRYGPRIGYDDWHRRATEALQRAVALDSSDVVPIQYLVLLAALEQNQSAVRQWAARHRAHANSGGQQTEFIEWTIAVALDDKTELARLRSRIPQMHPAGLQSIVEWSENLALGLEDGDRAARAYEHGRSGGQRRSVVMRLVPYLLNRGRPGAASRLLATSERGFGQASDVGVLEFQIYAALFWDGNTIEATAAADSLAAYLHGGTLRDGQVRDRASAACTLAHWRIAAGDFAGAAVALATPAPHSVESTLCRTAARAQLAVATHRSDAPAALAQLDSLLTAGVNVQQFFPTVAAVIAGRLHEACGDLEYALALTRRRTFWWNWIVSTPLREEGRLAALLGDTAGAIRAYRHYLALRSDPEPELLPETDRVRALLRTLELRASADPEVEAPDATRTIRDDIEGGGVK